MEKETIYKAFFEQLRRKLSEKMIKNPGETLVEIKELVSFVERLEAIK